MKHFFETHDIDVTHLVQPEVVGRRGRRHEITLHQLFVNFISGDIEFMQDPLLDQAFIACGLSYGCW